MGLLSFEQILSQPSALKMHDWMLLAGPIGKYALQGTMGPEQRKVVFDDLDLLSAVWSRRISVRDAKALKDQAYWVMARLEVYLPAWELDITRHMLLHMIEHIPEKGPVWFWSMWAYERLWNRLMQWKSQQAHPEHTVANQFKAFKVALTILSESAAAGNLEEGMVNFCRSFDRDTNSVLLPDYLEESGLRQVYLYDEKPSQRVVADGEANNKYWMLLELHKYYLSFQPEYKALWSRYLGDKGRSVDDVSNSAVATRDLMTA